MLNLYSIFVHYVLFFQKKLPPLPPIFQLMWGVLPTLPPSETASGENLCHNFELSVKMYDMCMPKKIMMT